MRVELSDGKSFDMDFQEMKFIDVSVRYVPGFGSLPIVRVGSDNEAEPEEVFRGEFQGIDEAFNTAKTVRNAILSSYLRTGILCRSKS